MTNRGNCFAPDCDSPLDNLIEALSLVAGFLSLERFPSARSLNEESASGLSLGKEPGSSFCATPRAEEDKKRQSVLLVSQPLASKDCPLSAGCWPSLLQGSRIQQPNLSKEKLPFSLSFTSREVPWFLCRRVSRSFSFSASTRSLLASSVDKMAALQLTQEWDGSGPPASSF